MDLIQRVDSLYEEAEIQLYEKDDYIKSYELINEILSVVDEKVFSDQDRADAYTLAAHLYTRLSDYEKAIQYAESTLAIDRAGGNPEDISSSLHTIAGIYQAANQPDCALHYINESIEIERKLDRPNRLAIRLGLASEIYVGLDMGQEAYKMAREALDLELKLDNQEKIGIRQAQLASAYQKLNDNAHAETMLEQAIDNLRASQSFNSLAITLNQLGAICYKRGEMPKAIAYYSESARLCKQTGNIMVEMKPLKQLALILKHTDPNTAIDHYERFIELSQQVYSEQSMQTLASFEVRYDTAQKEHQVEMLQKSMKWRHILIAILVVLLLMALFGIGLMQRISYLRTKQNHLLIKSNLMGITELGDMPVIHFTEREKDIIILCAQGLRDKEVADRLGLSVRTVSNYKYNIFRKLGVQNTVELLNYARRTGLIKSS